MAKRAAFVLLAAIMGMGGIFTFWVTTLTTTTLLPEEARKIEELCHLATFGVYSGDYDKSSNSLYLILQNKRSVDLELENLYLLYPNNVMKTIPLNEDLKGNVLKSINITGIDDGFKNGIIKTNCPGVSVDFTYSQVT